MKWCLHDYHSSAKKIAGPVPLKFCTKLAFIRLHKQTDVSIVSLFQDGGHLNRVITRNKTYSFVELYLVKKILLVFPEISWILEPYALREVMGRAEGGGDRGRQGKEDGLWGKGEARLQAEPGGSHHVFYIRYFIIRNEHICIF